jgi:hypothetical protein
MGRRAVDRLTGGRGFAALCRLVSSARLFRTADSEPERQRIFRFRYGLYHEELGRVVSGVDHDRRAIEDEMDRAPNTIHVYQERGGEIALAMRVIVWEAGHLPEAVKRDFDLARVPGADRYSYAEYGRLMARPRHRGSLRALALILSVTRMLVKERGIDALLATCKPGLVSRYVRLGLRPYTPRIIEYPDGLEVPLIAPLDRAYGRLARSPFRYIAPHNPAWQEHRAWESWARGDDEAAVSTDPERMAAELDALYAGIPAHSLVERAILEDLARAGGYILSIDQGTKLIQEGLYDRDIYIVLDGEVVIETGAGRRAVARRGDIVGEFALFLPLHRRSRSAYARRARILVIKASAVEALKARAPRRYIALIEVLARRIIAKLADWEHASDEPLPRPVEKTSR